MPGPLLSGAPSEPTSHTVFFWLILVNHYLFDCSIVHFKRRFFLHHSKCFDSWTGGNGLGIAIQGILNEVLNTQSRSLPNSKDRPWKLTIESRVFLELCTSKEESQVFYVDFWDFLSYALNLLIWIFDQSYCSSSHLIKAIVYVGPKAFDIIIVHIWFLIVWLEVIEPLTLKDWKQSVALPIILIISVHGKPWDKVPRLSFPGHHRRRVPGEELHPEAECELRGILKIFLLDFAVNHFPPVEWRIDNAVNTFYALVFEWGRRCGRFDRFTGPPLASASLVNNLHSFNVAFNIDDTRLALALRF